MSEKRNNIVVKVGMLGDVQIGKTSLMIKYVENKFDEDYIQVTLYILHFFLTFFFNQTLGVNFLEKKIPFDDADINVMVWDLGGQKGILFIFFLKLYFINLEFREMLDLVCNDALAILFMFDLSRKATLHSVKEWYMQSRKFNKKGKIEKKKKLKKKMKQFHFLLVQNLINF